MLTFGGDGVSTIGGSLARDLRNRKKAAAAAGGGALRVTLSAGSGRVGSGGSLLDSAGNWMFGSPTAAAASEYLGGQAGGLGWAWMQALVICEHGASISFRLSCLLTSSSRLMAQAAECAEGSRGHNTSPCVYML